MDDTPPKNGPLSSFEVICFQRKLIIREMPNAAMHVYEVTAIAFSLPNIHLSHQ
jgi:hypothetical protein